MLAVECSALGVERRPSTIKHDNAGMGLFAGRNFGKDEVVGYYYGSLLYMNLGKSRNSKKTVGKGFMKVNQEKFHKWALEVTGKGGMDWEGQKISIWIVPGPNCAMRYINDPRYLKSDRTPKKNRTRRANVVFSTPERTLRPSTIVHHNAQTVVALRNIVKGEELFVKYGTKYQMD